MDKKWHFPNTDQLSIITATTLLAYVIMPYIKISAQEIEIPFLGMIFNFKLNFSTVISLAAGIMAAFGTDWIIKGHPKYENQSSTIHLIIPSLTVMALAIPLNIINLSPQWWGVFILGSVIFLISLIAEYIAIDRDDARYPAAAMFLTAVSSVFSLILLISLRAAQYRLYSYVLVWLPFFFFFTNRIMHFFSKMSWSVEETAVVVFIVMQWIIGYHYWPISPLAFGLAITGPAYLTITIVRTRINNPRKSIKYLESFIILGIFWVFAYLFR